MSPMETPSSGPSAPSSSPGPSGPTEEAPSASDRAALDYLAREILPTLRRARDPALVAVVRAAVRSGELRRLGELTERQRGDLLVRIEERLARRPAASARAVVSLTAAIAALPSAPEPLGTGATAPAR